MPKHGSLSQPSRLRQRRRPQTGLFGVAVALRPPSQQTSQRRMRKALSPVLPDGSCLPFHKRGTALRHPSPEASRAPHRGGSCRRRCQQPVPPCCGLKRPTLVERGICAQQPQSAGVSACCPRCNKRWRGEDLADAVPEDHRA